MYTGDRYTPHAPLPEIVSSADKAEGFILLCRQSALDFGANRKVAVERRPVVLLKSDGTRLVVLPCTSKQHEDTPEHFALTPARVFWTKPDRPPGAAFWRYEVVDSAAAPSKIGTLNQNARVDLQKWVRSRY